MIVKDLLSQCSIEEVVSEIMCISGVSKGKWKRVYDLHAKFLDKLQRIEPILTEYVILGVSYLDGGSRIHDICLFSIPEIKEKFTKSSVLDNIKSLEALSNEEIETILKTLVLPDSYGFEFIPWEKVLGYQVDERSLMEFGKACMLARVIYEMTFFGFTEDQIAKERKKLDDAIAESEQMKSLSPEERKKQYIPAEKVFKEFRYRDNRTPEEKEEDRQKQYREILFNQLQKYWALKMYTEAGCFYMERKLV